MGNIIGYTQPYYGAYDPQKGYIPFVGRQPIYGQQPVAGLAVGNPQVNTVAPVTEAQPAYVNPNMQPNAVNQTVNQVANPVSPYATAGSVQNIQGTDMVSLGNGAWTSRDGGWFSKGINADGQTTYGGATGFQWAGAGINTALGLFNAYQSYQASKLAKAQFEDQRALNHANYRMNAKAFNNNLRNQQSGRGYIGMSGSAKRALGEEYNKRKAQEDY